MVFAIRFCREIPLTRPLSFACHIRTCSNKIETPSNTTDLQKANNRLLIKQVRAIQFKPREQRTEEDYDTLDKAEETFATTFKCSRRYDEWQKKVRETNEKDQ
jgi:hypothetical protein